MTPCFLLTIWVPVALGTTSNTVPTCPNAMVAMEIVLGIGMAAEPVTPETVPRCMPARILTGIAVIAFAVQQSPLPAFGLLLLLGVFDGFSIVPLDTLLQEYGKHSVGAGNTIAVQNLGENVAMLLMLGLCSLAVSMGVPPVAVGVGFGAVLAVIITALWVQGRHK